MQFLDTFLKTLKISFLVILMEFLVENDMAFTVFKGVRGTLSKADVDALITFTSGIQKGGKYLETGSYLGCSALIVASHTEATVYAHDIWVTDWSELKGNPPPEIEDYFYEFYKMVLDNKMENRIVPIRGNSTYTVGIHEDESIDIAFIDGDHSYEGCYGDLIAVYPKMKHGGTILAHDCYDGTEALKAVQDFARIQEMEVSYVRDSCGMAVFKKK
jgi:predicted O-methyltransferase YrrM